MITWQDLMPWIEETAKNLECDIPELARRADLAPATLLRGFTEQGRRFSPSFKVICKLALLSPIPCPLVMVGGNGHIRSEGSSHLSLDTGDITIEITVKRPQCLAPDNT